METEPDLRIALSPNRTQFYVGDKITITCIADKPPYISQDDRPLPPNMLQIFFNGARTPVASFGSTPVGKIEGSHTASLTKAAMNVDITCFTSNRNRQCRLQTLKVNVLERTNRMYLKLRLKFNSMLNIRTKYIQI